jgi:hypothetical protein
MGFKDEMDRATLPAGEQQITGGSLAATLTTRSALPPEADIDHRRAQVG